MAKSFSVDSKMQDRGTGLAFWLLEGSARYGTSMWSMVKDIFTLTRGPGKLKPDEYFLYQLCDNKRYTPEAKLTFAGVNLMLHLEAIQAQFGSPWTTLGTDKPTMAALLHGYGLPIPETQALRHGWRAIPGAEQLVDADAVKDFMRNRARYPLFSKPTADTNSLGVADIEAYDKESDCLVMADGRHVSVNDYAEIVEQYTQKGYLFQTRLVPHPGMVEVIGNRIGTVRMVVLVDDEGPHLLRSAWKMPVGENVADNFWRPGNLLGGIDVETGKLVRVRRRTDFGSEDVTEHPDTGKSFEDLSFPEWDSMRELALRAAAAISTCPLQGWDVALCADGPVLVELEGNGGHPMMSQICFETGLLDGRLKGYLEKTFAEYKKQKKQHGRMSTAMSELKQGIASLPDARKEVKKMRSKQEADEPSEDNTSDADGAGAGSDGSAVSGTSSSA